jgi:3-hexulose-6-phosphate synthase
VRDAGATIIVAGAAIYGAADPAAAAKEITDIAHAGGAAAGGLGKWLPWILIAGAVLLGLFLLQGGKPADEAPVEAAPAVEEAAPAEAAPAEAAPAEAAPAEAAPAEAAPAEAAPAEAK